MSLVKVTLVEWVVDTQEERTVPVELTEVRVGREGTEIFRQLVCVPVEDLHADRRDIDGKASRGWGIPDEAPRPVTVLESRRRSAGDHRRRRWSDPPGAPSEPPGGRAA